MASTTTNNATPQHDFRIYEAKDERGSKVRDFYYEKNSKQTLQYATVMKQKYGKLCGKQRTIEEAIAFMDTITDDSDPDTEASQLQHAMQTGEACRRMFPDLDWLHLTGFIHDLGKVLVAEEMGGLKQWEVVGDTYPVGCAFSHHIVYPEAFEHNPDIHIEKYNTPLGIYVANTGLKNVTMAWGHDEYLSMVLRNHPQCTLPSEAYAIIRFHSFYPWHNKGAYMDLCDQEDLAVLPLVQKFQKCDLYSKADVPLKWEGELKEYYVGLINKYIPGVVQW